MLKELKCKCGGSFEDMYAIKEGARKGLYCGCCGKWQKWLGKNGYNLIKLYENKIINKTNK